MTNISYKEILAALGIVIGFVSYFSYFKGIFFGQTKPHTFSWLIWTVINFTAFFAQLVKGGGAGAWIGGLNAACCLFVLISSFWKGEKNISWTDWVCLVFALSAIIGWLLTKNPLTAVILVCVTDIFAILPTFRKAYLKPFEENAFSFGIDEIKFVLQLFAFQSLNLVTVLFPIVILINDSSLVTMILIRRKQLKKLNETN